MKFLSLFFLVFLFSCTGRVEEKKIEIVNADKPPGIPGCYESIFGKDSSFLKLESAGGDSVKGNLWYHYFEKDRNEGDFNGKIAGKEIIGWYNFTSEGKFSVRQLVFKISGDSLIEGYGPISMKNDTATFKSISSLNYLEARPLVKIKCP